MRGHAALMAPRVLLVLTIGMRWRLTLAFVGLLPVVNRLAVAGEVNFMVVAKAETVGLLIKCFDRICNNPVLTPFFFSLHGL